MPTAHYGSTLYPASFAQFQQPQYASLSKARNNKDWSEFLGNPFKQVEPNEGVLTNQDTLPLAFRGQSKTLSSLITLGVYTSNEFTTSYLMPMAYSNEMSYNWEVQRYDPMLCPPVPERGQTRILSHYTTTGGTTTTRYGMGMLLLHGFLRTEAGRTSFINQLKQLNQSVIETQSYHVLAVLLTYSALSAEYSDKFFKYERRRVEDVIAWEQLFFDIFKRDEKAFQVIETEISNLLASINGEADAYVTTRRVFQYYNMIHPERTQYWLGGQQAVDRHNSIPYPIEGDNINKVLTFGSNTVFCTRAFETPSAKGRKSYDPMKLFHQFGEYHLAYDRDAGQTSVYERFYNSSRRSIGIYSWDDDKITQIDLDTIWNYQTRTDKQTGYFRSFNHPGMKTIDYQNDVISADPFHVALRDNSLVPVRFLGQMYPGKDIIEGFYQGKSNDADITAGVFADMAYCVVKNLSPEFPSMRQKWSSAVNTLHTLAELEVNDNSLNLLRAILNQPLEIRLAAGNPGKGIAHDRGVPVKVSPADMNGFISLNSLPETEYKVPAPLGFASLAGLKSLESFFLLHQRDLKNWGFDNKLMQAVSDAIPLFEAMGQYLFDVTNSVFLNPKNAPSWIIKPTPGAMLVANLIVGNLHPLYVEGGDKQPKDLGITGVEFGKSVEKDMKNINKILSSAIDAKSVAKDTSFLKSKDGEDTNPKSDISSLFDTLVADAQGKRPTENDRDFIKRNLETSVFLASFAEVLRAVDARSTSSIRDALKPVVNREMQPLLKGYDSATWYDRLMTAAAILFGAYKDQSKTFSANDALAAIKLRVEKLKKDQKDLMDLAIKTRTAAGTTVPGNLPEKTSMVMTPLTYSPKQYAGYMTQDSPVYPSGLNDPYITTSVGEYQRFKSLLDTISSHPLGSDEPPVPVSTSSRINVSYRVGSSLRQTPLWNQFNSRNIESKISSFAPSTRGTTTFSKAQPTSSQKRVGASFGDDEEGFPSTPSRMTSSERKREEEGDHLSKTYIPSYLPSLTIAGDRVEDDTSFLEHSYGNMEANFAWIHKTVKDNLISVISKVFVGMEMSYVVGSNLISNHIRMPFTFCLARPHIEVEAACLIKMASRGKTGRTFYGNAMMEFADDALQQTHYGTLTWYMAPTVYNELNLVRINAVFVMGYHGGCGANFVEHKFYHPTRNQWGKGSIFVITLPPTCKKLPTNFSLTGSYDGFGPDDRIHYNTAPFENAAHGWQEYRKGLDALSLVYGTRISSWRSSANYVVCSAPTWYHGPEKNSELTVISPGKSHFSLDCTYSGCSEARTGKLIAYKKDVWAGYAKI